MQHKQLFMQLMIEEQLVEPSSMDIHQVLQLLEASF